MVTLERRFPKIATLCGSSRFKEDHENVMRELTLQGYLVIGLGLFGHLEPTFDMNSVTKKELDALHFRKIELSDEVYIVNPARARCSGCKSWVFKEKCQCNKGEKGGIEVYPYLGDSTRREIAYARLLGKAITYMNPHPVEDLAGCSPEDILNFEPVKELCHDYSGVREQDDSRV